VRTPDARLVAAGVVVLMVLVIAGMVRSGLD
jgi:hypothetical protein